MWAESASYCFYRNGGRKEGREGDFTKGNFFFIFFLIAVRMKFLPLSGKVKKRSGDSWGTLQAMEIERESPVWHPDAAGFCHLL